MCTHLSHTSPELPELDDASPSRPTPPRLPNRSPSVRSQDSSPNLHLTRPSNHDDSGNRWRIQSRTLLDKKAQPIGPCLPDDRAPTPTEGGVCGKHICSMACVVCVALNLDHGTTRRCAVMSKLSEHTRCTITAAYVAIQKQRASAHVVGSSIARPGALLVLAMRV